MSVFKPDTIGEVIAERRLSVEGSLNGISAIRVLMGKPERTPNSTDCFCPFQVIGIGSDKVRCAYGIDEFQAIQLAMAGIGAYLDSLNEAEGKHLRWEGDELGDLGFPPAPPK